MKHIKEFELNEEFRHHGYEASTFADITTDSIIQILKGEISDMGYEKKFLANPNVNRYLENHAKDMMNGFWNEIKNKEKIEELSKQLEREMEGPDHPIFPMGLI